MCGGQRTSKIMTPPWSKLRPQIKSVSQCQVNKNKMFSTKCHKRNRMKLLQKVSLSLSSFEWVSIYQCHSEASTEFQFMPWSIDRVIDLDYQKSEKNSPIQVPRMLLRTRCCNCWGDATELSINFNKIAFFSTRKEPGKKAWCEISINKNKSHWWHVYA